MLDLVFTDSEMRTFLKKRGYSEVTIQTWDNISKYHNQVETVKNSIEGMKKSDEVLPLDEDGEMAYSEAEFKYSLRAVFNKELKKALLQL
jgi:hypothetical protein